MAPTDKKEDPRLTFQEVMEMVPLPSKEDTDGKELKRYMSRRAAWLPGLDLTSLPEASSYTELVLKVPIAVYGGHVYTQSALAACRSMEELTGKDTGKQLGIHSIHGLFTSVGLADRPFIYTTTPLSASSRTFATALVTATQPTTPSSPKDHYPLSSVSLPQSPSCFQALVSFKSPSETQVLIQEAPPQLRFSSILHSRHPCTWPPAPVLDIAGILAIVPAARTLVGTFPAVEMRKVDMRDWNTDRPVQERRELICYRLLAPLPMDAPENDHVLVHVYECDRNGLLMLGNHLGLGERLAGAASLAWTYVVHGNTGESRVEFVPPGQGGRKVSVEGDAGAEGEWWRGWWIQEVLFPQAGAGRGIVMSKIWSPEGKHVGTEYQDGIVRGINGGGKL